MSNLGIVLAHQNRHAEAVHHFQCLLTLQPENCEAHFNLGIVFEQQEDFTQAQNSYERALSIKHNHHGALMNLGGLYRTQGNPRQSADCFLRALSINSHSADAYFNLGLAFRDLEQPELALTNFRKALSLNERDLQVCCELAAVQIQLGHKGEAMASLKRGLRVDENDVRLNFTLGSMLDDQGEPDNASLYLQKALEGKSNHLPSLLRLATIHTRRGHLADAEALHRQAVEEEPGRWDLHLKLGLNLEEQGRAEEAEVCFKEVLRLSPNNPAALNNLGTLYQCQNTFDRAEQLFRQVLSSHPGHRDALLNLTENLRIQGRAEEAADYMDQALQLMGGNGLEIRAALTCPIIYKDNAEITTWRQRVQHRLANLLQEPPTCGDPHFANVQTAFFLSYHGQNDRQLMTDLARVTSAMYPQLDYTAPHCRPSPSPKARLGKGSKIRIAFISKFLYDGHTIAKLTNGLIANLSRQDFAVYVGFLGRPSDKPVTELETKVDMSFDLPRSISLARQFLADKECDIIVYPDIGMAQASYCMAFSRLAPVQCVTWGHPDTTGIGNLDYYISSSDLEPSDAQEHYSENLILLDNLPTYYYRPILPDGSNKGRSHFGLPEQKHLYLCPQSLFKYHPDFDDLVAAILRQDQNGELLAIGSPPANYQSLLKKRWQVAIPDVSSRIRFLDHLTYTDFLAVLANCNVMLDSIHFGGGNTNFEAFAVGTPVVTMPGRFMRSRVAYACYRKMNIHDCIADTPERYVEIALRLGTDADFRRTISETIQTNNSILYENLDAVKELGQFLVKAHEQAQKQ